MKTPDHWDSLIQTTLQNLWPGMDWRLIKCQIRQESAFNPNAVSPCGAVGLLQIMPATGQSLGVSREKLFDPETNLRTGISYLKQQYEHFPEIPDRRERIKFALASYNGGRGYINRAIALAGKEDAPWQTWEGVKDHLASANCTVHGRHPDHRQIINYVDRIWADYTRLSPPATQAVLGEADVPSIPNSNGKGDAAK
jgi:membrane-bound lytic murein transglycosylase MltF